MSSILIKDVSADLLREVNYVASKADLTQRQFIIQTLEGAVNGKAVRTNSVSRQKRSVVQQSRKLESSHVRMRKERKPGADAVRSVPISNTAAAHREFDIGTAPRALRSGRSHGKSPSVAPDIRVYVDGEEDMNPLYNRELPPSVPGLPPTAAVSVKAPTCKLHHKAMKDYGTKWLCDGPPQHTEAK